jgi:hypothetical protein
MTTRDRSIFLAAVRQVRKDVALALAKLEAADNPALANITTATRGALEHVNNILMAAPLLTDAELSKHALELTGSIVNLQHDVGEAAGMHAEQN